mmetsp:Transcript_71032/g.167435  ORF Transcript_71032/g.167435 Transcript_71032/m.167435 type:complete len:228 (+) Transcript_71032:235-918(+)
MPAIGLDATAVTPFPTPRANPRPPPLTAPRYGSKKSCQTPPRTPLPRRRVPWKRPETTLLHSGTRLTTRCSGGTHACVALRVASAVSERNLAMPNAGFWNTLAVPTPRPLATVRGVPPSNPRLICLKKHTAPSTLYVKRGVVARARDERGETAVVELRRSVSMLMAPYTTGVWSRSLSWPLGLWRTLQHFAQRIMLHLSQKWRARWEGSTEHAICARGRRSWKASRA